MKSIGTVSRRHFLALSGLAAAGVLHAVDGTSSVATGRVYLDPEGTGQDTPNLVGISGVKVTNGRDVTVTDANGTFSLPTNFAKFRFITVTKPAGYNNTTSFYCPRKDGSPYSFGLKPVYEAKNPRFVHVTDTEMTAGDKGDWTWVAILNEYAEHHENVAFIIDTGDICYEAGLTSTAERFKTTRRGIPVYYTLGNHDLLDIGGFGEAHYESLFGPTYYSFDVGNTHCVVTPMLSGDFPPNINREDVEAWLKNDLKSMKPGQTLIAFNHDLLTSGKEFNYGSINLNAHNLVAWLYGHWHINLVRKQGNVMSITPSPLNKGGIDNAPSNFYDIELTKTGIGKIEVHYTYARHTVVAMPMTDTNAKPNSCIIHAYDSVAKVTVFAVASTQIPFEKVNDWSYRLLPDTALTGDVTVTFSDGQTVTKPLNPTTSGITPLWVNAMKGKTFRAAPVICDNLVYIATTEDGMREDCSVAAFDKMTGRKHWDTHVPNSINNNIVVSKNRVFAIDAEDVLTILDAKTGKIVKTIAMSGAKLPANVTGLAEENGTVYAGFHRSFSAINAQTMTQIWRGGNYARDGTVARHKVHGNYVFSSSHWDALYCHDKRTGVRLWGNGDDGMRFRSSAPLSMDANTILVASDEKIKLLDPATGSVKETIATNHSFMVASDPIKVGNLVILGTANHGVVAYDTQTWTQVWTIPVGKPLFYTASYTQGDVQTVESSVTLTPDGTQIIFGASDGVIRLATISDGTVRASYDVGAPVMNKVICDEEAGIYYIADFAGGVTAFTLA